MVEKGLHLAIGVGLTGVITHQVVVYHVLVHFRRERERERESQRQSRKRGKEEEGRLLTCTKELLCLFI